MKKISIIALFISFSISLMGQKPGSGSCLEFDGFDDKVSITHDARLNSDSFITIEAWIKADVWAADVWGGSIVSKDGWANNAQGYVLRVGDAGKLSFNIGGGQSGGDWIGVITPALMNTGEWYHVAGTFDGDTMRAYINGILEAKKAYSRIISGSTYDLTIGGMAYAPGGNRAFDGQIDEVRVWNKGMSTNELRSWMCSKPNALHPKISNLIAYYNFDAGTGLSLIDRGSNKINGTLANGPQWQNSNVPLGDKSTFNYGSGSPLALYHADGSSFGIDTLVGGVGVHLFLVSDTPNTIQKRISGKMDITRYYGVHVIGDKAFNYSVKYNYGKNSQLNGIVDEEHVKLIYRDIYNDNAARWSAIPVYMELDTSAKTIFKCGETKNREFAAGVERNIKYRRIINSCDSTYFKGWRYASQIIRDTLKSYFGCDSLRITDIRINYSRTEQLPDISICNGDSVLIHSIYRKVAGNYLAHLKTKSGCDSIVEQKLVVNPLYKSVLPPITICEGDGLMIFGNYQTKAGTYISNEKSIFGCDSITSQELKVITKSNLSNAPIKICAGDSAYIFGTYKKVKGTYIDTIKSNLGCDSIIRTQELTVNPLYDTTLNSITICAGESIVIFGKSESRNGNYFKVFTSVFGCDSVVRQSLIVNQVNTAIQVTSDTLKSLSSGGAIKWLSCENWSHSVEDTNRIFIPKVTGDYAAEVTENMCKDTSTCYTVTIETGGIFKSKNKSFIVVKPNPVSDVLNIDLGKNYKNVAISLTDISGKRLMEQVLEEGSQFSYNISSLASGTYLLSVNILGIKDSIRIIKMD